MADAEKASAMADAEKASAMADAEKASAVEGGRAFAEEESDKREAQLCRLVGAADVCELMAELFRFPEEGALAAALVDGRFAADARGALFDAGAPLEALGESDRLLAPFRDLDAEALQRDLRRGYSLLFLAPGAKVPVWPYEAPFRYRSKGRAGAPSLFRSPVTLAVAASMNEVGFKPSDATEPPDSVTDELSFLSALITSAVSALQAGDETAAQTWLGKARQFWDDHPGQWLPSFMDQVQQEAPLCKSVSRYDLLAQWSALALAVLASSAEHSEDPWV